MSFFFFKPKHFVLGKNFLNFLWLVFPRPLLASLSLLLSIHLPTLISLIRPCTRGHSFHHLQRTLTWPTFKFCTKPQILAYLFLIRLRPIDFIDFYLIYILSLKLNLKFYCNYKSYCILYFIILYIVLFTII